ncbi:DNA-methyltransferase [Yersinia sp. Marseille-Q5920]|uniref:DNA-methyltransferase n=1 Tax=Yersinia sp. Marseille-Q5920 TaxID=2972785 RepID=UPI0022645676|nr:site-specific DNA-methyltransferase [Yersinia sp. Marseille-Q5920]
MSYQIFIGDCIDSMRKMADQSIHSCITSPPYYGLRDYGVEGQIGLEESPEVFIQKLVAVFREVRRVLRDDGTLWVNMGDSWGKGKQLYGMPWRFAFALQNDGWILRQDIIWHKSNPMPESVRDRCTKAHEYIFLLSKSKNYYFDHEVIREPSVYNGKNTGVGFGHGMDKSDRNRGRIQEEVKTGVIGKQFSELLGGLANFITVAQGVKELAGPIAALLLGKV